MCVPGGLVCNSHKVDNVREFIKEIAAAISTQNIHFVPRQNIVQKTEFNKKNN